MKHYFKPKTWLITIMMYLVAISLSILIVDWQQGAGTKVAQAGSEHNVAGWAWSENFGWVSFNSTDCDANDDNLSDGVPAGCPAIGTAIPNYGVNIDSTTSNFSGYGWSSNLGWLSFQESSAPNYSFNLNCPSTCNSSSDCTACYNPTDSKVYGWAKILSLGDDGWLKMNDSWANGVIINPTSGDFSGWAWNGNDTTGVGLGWLSFNCLNDGSCIGANYKVSGAINKAPEAQNLTSPNWNYYQACQNGALRAFLKWQFVDADSGDIESAYQIIVSDNPSYHSPLFDTGKCVGYHAPDCLIGVGVDSYPVHSQITLNYDQKYYWWVKVWDNYGLESALTQYDSATDTDNDDGDNITFTTYKHEFPQVNKPDWFPVEPSQGEEVKFTDKSNIYLISAPTTAVPCDSSKCNWFWTVPADATIDDPATSTPTIIFNSTGNQIVTLKVTDTDGDGYYCSSSYPVPVNTKLPSWKEVKPE